MKKNPLLSGLRFFILFLYFISAILPLYWILITSFKGPKEIYTFPLAYLPKAITFASYAKLFSFNNFGKYFLNSLLLSLICSFLAMSIAVFSGFALSRLAHRKIKNGMELFLYFTQTIPSFMLMIPLFTIFAKLRMTNNLSSLGIVYITSVIAFSTLMAKSFFNRIPAAIDEAAKIDGCTLMQSIVRVVLPITLPGMIAIFSFAFINIWNELFLAVMLINSPGKMTIPVALNSFISKAGISWDVMSAGIVIALLPTMIVFGIGQRYIVAGLTEGGVKG